MADIVTPRIRSRMMSGIRGKDTKPEMIVRRGLFRLGYRYRLHSKRLPGKPDLEFRSRSSVIFVHGCFWHGHDCPLFKWPSSRPEFWRSKISRNRENDEKALTRLNETGWRVLTIWECALKGRGRWPDGKLIQAVARWLDTGRLNLELKGDDYAGAR